jgi:hypothetical protein
MAQQVHRVVANGNARPFDMGALRRLAIWGVLAAVALSVAVLAGYANPAAQRLLETIAAAIGQTQRRVEATPAPAAIGSAEAESETRRLAEAVRTLAADRNELLTRTARLSKASKRLRIDNRQTAAESLPPPPSPAPAALVPASAPGTPSSTVETVSPLLNPPPDPVAVVSAEHPPTPNWVATLPAIGGSAGADLFKPKIEYKSEFGVDIGGAVNFDALRVLWKSTKAAHAALLDGLSPRVTVRENSKSRAAGLRLIVGPLPDAETASRLCAILSAARRSCQPAPFAGQHFALTSSQPERKPAPAAERKPLLQPARQPARATP